MPQAQWVHVATNALPACPLTAEIRARIARMEEFWVGPKSPQAVEIEVWSGSKDAVHVKISPSRTTSWLARQASAKTPSLALERAWPAELGPLGPKLVAPNRAALRAACGGLSAEAREAAGMAIGPLLPHLHDLSAPRARSVWDHWAKALSEKTSRTAAYTHMKKVVAELDRSRLAPVWRTKPFAQTSPSVAVFGQIATAFAQGTMIGMDVRSGLSRWQMAVGRADPTPIPSWPGGPFFIIQQDGVLAFNPNTGAQIWRQSVPGVVPSLHRVGRVLYVAGENHAIAMEASTGVLSWKRKLLFPASAGPVGNLGTIFVPTTHRVEAISSNGQEERQPLLLEDELSGPLVPDRFGYLWVPVGGDEVRRYDPEGWRVTARVRQLVGLQWPPLVFGDRLAILIQRNGRAESAWLDTGINEARPSRFVSAHQPLLSLPNYSGFLHPHASRRQLVGRDAGGTSNYRIKTLSRINSVQVHRNLALVGGRNRIERFDVSQRKRIGQVEVDGEVFELAMNDEIEMARLDDGTIYGWAPPEHPSWQVTRQWARQDLARLALQANRIGPALQVIEHFLSRSPRSLPMLQLRAEALTNRRSKQAFEAWWRLLAHAPPSSAPFARARSQMSTLGASFENLEGAISSKPASETLTAKANGLRISAKNNVVTAYRGQESLEEPPKEAWKRSLPGRQIFRLQWMEDPERPLLMAVTDRAASLIDPRSGASRGRISFRTAMKTNAVAVTEGFALVREMGSLRLLKLRPLRSIAHMRFSTEVQLVAAGHRFLVTPEDGPSFLIDPEQARQAWP